MRKLHLLFFALLIAATAQAQISSYAAKRLVSYGSAPSGCAPGDVYYNTAAQIGYFCDATATWHAMGGGGGSVTTFSAGTLSPLFTTTVNTPTSTPALSFTLSNAGAYTLFGNVTASSAAPQYNSMDTLFGSCSAGTSALTYNTSTHVFGCNSIAGGVSSFDSLTGALTTAIGTTGTAPNYSQATTVDTLNIPMAATNAVTAGLISNADYQTLMGLVGQTGNTPQYIAPQVVNGCSVEYVNGLTYNVGFPCVYQINGVTYSLAAEVPVTLPDADGTYDRIDAIIVDDTSTATYVEGPAVSSPAVLQPTVDASTQLELTFAYVAALATAPSNVTRYDIYHQNTEWTTSDSSGTYFALASATNPYAGDYPTNTVDVNATTAPLNAWVQFAAPSGTIDLGTLNALVFYIRSKATWNTARNLSINWRNAGTIKGTTIVLRDGQFGFSSSNTSVYQAISIPTSLFGDAGIPVNQLRFTVTGGTCTGTCTIGFYLDDITLQGGSVSTPLPSNIMTRGAELWSATTAYPANAAVTYLGMQYVASVANTGQTPATGSAYWFQTNPNATTVNGGALPVSANVTKTNASSQLVAATYADLVALWASGSCTGLLNYDGTCVAAGGVGVHGTPVAGQFATWFDASHVQGVWPGVIPAATSTSPYVFTGSGASGDQGTMLVLMDPSDPAGAMTLAQAGTTGFDSNYYIGVQNTGTKTWTITTTVSVFVKNGVGVGSTVDILPNENCALTSDNSDYLLMCSESSSASFITSLPTDIFSVTSGAASFNAQPPDSIFASPPSSATPAVVQAGPFAHATPNVGTAASTSIAGTLSYPTSPGNSILVFLEGCNGSCSTVTINDPQSDTFTLIYAANTYNEGGYFLANGIAGGTTTFTVADANGYLATAIALELTPVAATTPLDASNSASANTVSFATSTAGDLLIAAGQSIGLGQPWTVDSPFILQRQGDINSSNQYSNALATSDGSVVGTYSVTFHPTHGTGWVGSGATIIALKPGAPDGKPRMMHMANSQLPSPLHLSNIQSVNNVPTASVPSMQVPALPGAISYQGGAAQGTIGSPLTLMTKNASDGQVTLHASGNCTAASATSFAFFVTFTDTSSTAVTLTPAVAPNCTTLGPASMAAIDMSVNVKASTAITYYSTITSTPAYDLRITAQQNTTQ